MHFKHSKIRFTKEKKENQVQMDQIQIQSQEKSSGLYLIITDFKNMMLIFLL